MNSKQYLAKKLELFFNPSGVTKLLDLGSGQSKNIIPLLEKYPNLYYVGVEPQTSEANIAQKLLSKFPHAKIYNQLAYDPVPNENDFDICVSLSVLEHVKQLEKFLINSIKAVKSGGRIIHIYDLGHALYPKSLKEKFQIFLGTKFPWILPEKKFVRYLDVKQVSKILIDNGATVEKITYHQMPNHKAFLKNFQADTPEKLKLVEEIMEWEYKVSKFLPELDQKQRELLFPTINIQAIKK